MPIILVSNDSPELKSLIQNLAFSTRVEECKFDKLNEDNYLDDDRLAKTLLVMLKNRDVQKLKKDVSNLKNPEEF